MKKIQLSDIEEKFIVFRHKITPEERDKYGGRNGSHVVAVRVEWNGNRYDAPAISLFPSELKLHVKHSLINILYQINLQNDES